MKKAFLFYSSMLGFLRGIRALIIFAALTFGEPAAISAFSPKEHRAGTGRKEAALSPANRPGLVELLQFTPSALTTEVPSGRKKEIKVHLNNSDEDPVQVKLTATEIGGKVPDWLLFKNKTLAPSAVITHSLGSDGNEIFFTIDASALAEGDYQAKVKAEAVGYVAGELTISLTVLSFNEGLRPYVTAVRPADGATHVKIDQSVSVDLDFPSGKSLDGNTVHPGTVKLYQVLGETKVEVTGTAVNATAAGDAITLSGPLERGKTYEFHITDRVKDGNGYAIRPFTSQFTTAVADSETPTDLSGVSFTERVLIDQNFGSDGFTSLAIGPDRRLYATTSGGKIERWDIASDGSLANHTSLSPFGSDRRLLIGFAFDPAATTDNLISWISHSTPEFKDAADWTGKVSRVDLKDPANLRVQDFVVNLPRSTKDHATNGLAFGPDKALYILQGGNNAMGAPDAAWGHRPERLLSAALLRLDLLKAQQWSLPVDVKTEEGGSYNPFSANAPLTIHATGIRNAYDLIWHSNGQLYVPTNGSAAGGNTPALKSGMKWSNGQIYSGPNVPALQNVRATQNDFLFRVEKGGYYGHPNPLRNEYIMNGGNPTANKDPGEVTWVANGKLLGYPVGTPSEPNYRGWVFDFGLNFSPNGVIEYKSNAFGGKLQGKLLICRFSGGDDILVLEPGSRGREIIRATDGSQIPGFRRPFANPLDLTEDPMTGNLYLSEYFDGNGDGKPRITLLRASQPAVPAAYTLSLVKVGDGEVTLSPERSTYPAGTEVSLSAVPASGFEFVAWSGGASGSQNPLILTMNANKAITATFRKMVYTSDGSLRINAGGNEQVIAGFLWSGCQNLDGCSGYVSGGGPYTRTNLSPIAEMPPLTAESLFRSAWTSRQPGNQNSLAFTYSIPVEEGQYLVRLYFAETEKTGQGQRVFDINIEGGRREVMGLDLYKEAGGANRAFFLEIPARITDGTVTIDFIRQIDNPLVNAIEIVPSTALPSTGQPKQALWAYPNPAPKDRFMVDLEGFGKNEEVSLSIYNSSGQIVSTLTLVMDTGGAFHGQILPEKSITKGLYLIRATSPTGESSVKILFE